MQTTFGQNKTVAIKYDTSISVYSGWFCATLSDSTKYKEKGFNIENEDFDILKKNNKYYLQKSVGHRQTDSMGNLIFHNHTFEEITLDSIPYLPITENQYRLLKKEYIKPFTFRYTNSANKTVQKESTESHPCIIHMKFSLKGNSFDKEINIRNLEQSDTSQTTDNKTIIATLDNINYEFNQKLLSIKIFQYIMSLISKFDNENKFVLKH